MRHGSFRTGAVDSLHELVIGPQHGGRRFADRHDAGRRLASLLAPYREKRPIVVGMARGGVPVAAEVADALGAPLDVVVVRKVGAPHQREYAIGALAEGGIRVVDDAVVQAVGIGPDDFEELVAAEQRELDARLERYRRSRPPLDVRDRTVLLVDDGLATGRSARAAALSLRDRGAACIVLAVPVGAPSSLQALRDCVDDVVSVEAPADMRAVGLWYEDFRPIPDHEVIALLDAHRPSAALVEREVAVDAGLHLLLPGDLALPANARGVVAFAHGSGSSRLSPRNRAVAAALNRAGIATLLFDLLTPAEESDRRNVFDIALLAERLLAATRWLREQPDTEDLPLGYFGASTGAAAALVAAAAAGPRIRAVVSRGGRPDLAGAQLPSVTAPTLLIVGGDDQQVLELNRRAREQLRCPGDLVVVPGATHLFEEPGTLEAVAVLAVDWFTQQFARPTDEDPRPSSERKES